MSDFTKYVDDKFFSEMDVLLREQYKNFCKRRKNSLIDHSLKLLNFVLKTKNQITIFNSEIILSTLEALLDDINKKITSNDKEFVEHYFFILHNIINDFLENKNDAEFTCKINTFNKNLYKNTICRKNLFMIIDKMMLEPYLNYDILEFLVFSFSIGYTGGFKNQNDLIVMNNKIINLLSFIEKKNKVNKNQKFTINSLTNVQDSMAIEYTFSITYAFCQLILAVFVTLCVILFLTLIIFAFKSMIVILFMDWS